MAESSKDAWVDVGERFSSWGRRLSDRYNETGGAETRETQRKLEEAAHEIGEQLNRAFTALGDTLRDDAAKQELREAVGAIGEAVSATVSEAGTAIRQRVASGSSASERPDEPTESN